MSSPMRPARRRNHAPDEEGSPAHRNTNSRVSYEVTITFENVAYKIQLGASRIANVLPTYDFISGNAVTSPAQPLQKTFRQLHATRTGVSSTCGCYAFLD